MEWLWVLIIGGVAGWLAGMVMTGRGFGALGNIVVGVVGALIGNWALGAIGLNLSFFLEALLGAIVLLIIAGLFKRSEATI